MRISKISIITLFLCLILPLNSALAEVTPTQSEPKAATSIAKKAVKKEVKKPVKKVVKKKVVKKVIEKEVKKSLPKPESSTPAPVTLSPTSIPAEKTAPKTYGVAIQNFAFAPPELKIKVGDSVKFTQKDSVAHTVDTDPHPDHTQLPGFVSGSLSQGQSYTHTFTKAGTFTYHCSPHPSMKGKIIVEE